jgi:hypothetical protein
MAIFNESDNVCYVNLNHGIAAARHFRLRKRRLVRARIRQYPPILDCFVQRHPDVLIPI